MKKQDAIKYLNVSGKTLERYVKKGRLRQREDKSETGIPIVVYDDAEIEVLKAELQVARVETDTATDTTDTALATMPQEGRAVALIAAVVRETLEQAQERATAPQKPGAADVAHKLLLSLEECQTLTGLSRGVLRAAIDAGDLKARRIGRGWKVKRNDLEEYVNGL